MQQAVSPGEGAGIMVFMIFMVFPQTGQVIFGLVFCFRLVNGLTRRINQLKEGDGSGFCCMGVESHNFLPF